MSNMSYCRFQNTLEDLKDCYDNMDDLEDSEDAGSNTKREIKARKRLVALCKQIADDYEDLLTEE